MAINSYEAWQADLNKKIAAAQKIITAAKRKPPSGTTKQQQQAGAAKAQSDLDHFNTLLHGESGYYDYLQTQVTQMRDQAAAYQRTYKGARDPHVKMANDLLSQATKLDQQSQLYRATATPTANASTPGQAQADQAAPPPAPPAPVDPFAGKTKPQIQAMQRSLGVTADGIVGPKTRAAYDRANGTSTATMSTAGGTGAVRTRATGGGGGGTVTAPAGAPAAPAAPQTDQQITDYARTHYQYLAAYLDDPEIGPILKQAARQGITDPAVLRGLLAPTQFWQHTTESQRVFDANGRLDSATQQDQITRQANQLSTQAKSMGINIDPGQLNTIAKDSLRNGWSPQMVQQALGHQFQYQTAQGGVSRQTGEALTTEQNLKQIAGDYLVPLSDSTLAQWEGQILSGDVTPDQFKAYAQEQAKSLFPGLAKAIDSGITVKQYISPYANIASQELERPADSFDFTDPKFMRGISTIDPKTGDRTAMNLSDWQSYLRSMPEWKTTNRANDMSSQLTQQLLTTFGATT